MSKTEVSISDIAAECHVSAMTVSRVLRQSACVRSETREKVLAAAERLGYLKGSRLGRPAGLPPEQHTRVRLLCGVAERGPVLFQMRLLSAIERALTARNCECVLYCGTGDYRTFLRLREAALETRAQATFIIGDFPEDQLAALISAFPGAVLLDNPGLPDIDATFSSFAFDNAEAAKLALQHLSGRGFRKPVIITGPAEHFFSREISAGAEAFRKDTGIAPAAVLSTDFTPAGAERVMREFLKSGIPFDSVFTNDEMAAGVYRALLSSGKKIPEDAAVCGCDNLPSGAMLYPSLTTISLDYEELAKHAVTFVLRGDRDKRPLRKRLVPSLLIRESTTGI